MKNIICKILKKHKEIFIHDSNSKKDLFTGHYYCIRCRKITGGIGRCIITEFVTDGSDGYEINK